MNTSDLQKNYHIFGNKGNVWANECHIAESGFSSTTLCGVPMLSNNWARIEEVKTIGCKECLKIYNEKVNNSVLVTEL